MATDKQQLFNINKTETQVIDTVLSNVILMLSNRVYMSSNDKVPLIAFTPDTIKNNLKSIGEDTYTVKTNNGETYAIKIIQQKIATINKPGSVVEFLDTYSKNHKILIASDFSTKAYETIRKYGKVELFREAFLMSDTISHHYQPKFILLSRTEMKEVLEKYNLKEVDLQKMEYNDPAARYFNLKKGDIIRIIRYSPTSGYSPGYRIVA
jgi:DNA-directed RNA polymerase subunit H (RpoH/RPB5)